MVALKEGSTVKSVQLMRGRHARRMMSWCVRAQGDAREVATEGTRGNVCGMRQRENDERGGGTEGILGIGEGGIEKVDGATGVLGGDAEQLHGNDTCAGTVLGTVLEGLEMKGTAKTVHIDVVGEREKPHGVSMILDYECKGIFTVRFVDEIRKEEFTKG